MPEFQRFSYDVLVIGAGGAGCALPSKRPDAASKLEWFANRCWAKRTR